MPIRRTCLVTVVGFCAMLAGGCSHTSAPRVVVRPHSRPASVSRPDPLTGLNDALTFRAAAQRQHLFDVAHWESATKRPQARSTARVEPVSRAQAVPAPSGAAPSGERCPYAPLIRSIWQRDAEWAIGIAWRESNCQPTAMNASGSAGLFQLLGHADMLRYACPGQDPATSWAVPECNVRAAWHLYEGAGRAPWRL